VKRGIHFKEQQKFRQPWLWYLMISGVVISIVPLLVFIVNGKIPLGEALLVIAGVLLLNLITIGAFYFATLETKISEDGIAYRWSPFFKKFTVLGWNEVEYVSMRKYAALKFGYHRHKEFGRVHNVDGMYGFHVVMSNGKKYFFGTQQRLSVETTLRQTGKMRL
jgi:hypothetical protein